VRVKNHEISETHFTLKNPICYNKRYEGAHDGYQLSCIQIDSYEEARPIHQYGGTLGNSLMKSTKPMSK